MGSGAGGGAVGGGAVGGVGSGGAGGGAGGGLVVPDALVREIATSMAGEVRSAMDARLAALDASIIAVGERLSAESAAGRGAIERLDRLESLVEQVSASLERLGARASADGNAAAESPSASAPQNSCHGGLTRWTPRAGHRVAPAVSES